MDILTKYKYTWVNVLSYFLVWAPGCSGVVNEVLPSAGLKKKLNLYK